MIRKYRFYESVLDCIKDASDELRDYLKENTFLFTLVGVFGAISVYSVEIIDRTGMSGTFVGKTATVTGFSLVVLLSVVAIFDLLIRIKGNNMAENSGLVVFASFFAPLIYIVVGILTQFTEIWRFYYFSFSYLFGMSAPIISLTILVNTCRKVIDRHGISDTVIPISIFIYGFVGTMVVGRYGHITNQNVFQQEGLPIDLMIESLSVFLIFGIAITTIICGLSILSYLIMYLSKSIRPIFPIL